MNRLVSYNWLKEYVPLKVSAEEFARAFSLSSMAIERIIPLTRRFKDIVTARITAIEPHPNADRLRLATVETGRGTQTVVCGAPNIEVGQIIALANEGSVVVDPDEPDTLVTIKRSVIRGVESQGMICAASELGLGKDYSGVLVLPSDTPVGVALEEVLPPVDTLFDLEITSNRPDAMSIIGLAREAAAVFGARFHLPAPSRLPVAKTKLPLRVTVKESSLCRRYQAAVVEGVTIQASPLWLQLRLLGAGIRPINNIVDITNYVLLESGQPLHAFDYDKITGQKIIVRRAQAKEQLAALDGQTYQLQPDQLVIADQHQPIAIAGVMGGTDSAVGPNTTRVVFEAANFDPGSVRKTARLLNLHSESSDLFEKNLHPAGTTDALLRAVGLSTQLAGGKLVGPVVDSQSRPYQSEKIEFDPAETERLLGVALQPRQVKGFLTGLGFGVTGMKKLTVMVPWWRAHDVTASHDLVEEIARLYGYQRLPSVLPAGQLPAISPDENFIWEDQVKDLLVSVGFTEVYNYPLVGQELLARVGLDLKRAVKVANPLNEDMEYLRTMLTPQLLENVAKNQHQVDSLKLFELSSIHGVAGEQELPMTMMKLAGVMSGMDEPFFYCKGVVTHLLKQIGIAGYQCVVPQTNEGWWQEGVYLAVMIQDHAVGMFGLVDPQLAQKFDLKKPVALFAFSFDALVKYAATTKVYQALPEFPAIVRDIAIVVDQRTSWGAIEAVVQDSSPLLVAVQFLSTFSSPELGAAKKSLAFRLTLRAPSRTLRSEEADAVVQDVIDRLKKKCDATIR